MPSKVFYVVCCIQFLILTLKCFDCSFECLLCTAVGLIWNFYCVGCNIYWEMWSLCNVHSRVCRVNCVVCYGECVMCSLEYKMESRPCIIYILNSVLWSLHCFIFTVHETFYNANSEDRYQPSCLQLRLWNRTTFSGTGSPKPHNLDQLIPLCYIPSYIG